MIIEKNKKKLKNKLYKIQKRKNVIGRRKNPKANSTSNRKNGNRYNEIKAKRYSKNNIKYN